MLFDQKIKVLMEELSCFRPSLFETKTPEVGETQIVPLVLRINGFYIRDDRDLELACMKLFEFVRPLYGESFDIGMFEGYYKTGGNIGPGGFRQDLFVTFIFAV